MNQPFFSQYDLLTVEGNTETSYSITVEGKGKKQDAKADELSFSKRAGETTINGSIAKGGTDLYLVEGAVLDQSGDITIRRKGHGIIPMNVVYGAGALFLLAIIGNFYGQT